MNSDFDAFVREHYPTVVRTVALAVGDPHVAEDATQDAFVKASLRWRRVQLMERPVGWVHVVAMNAARRALRRRPERAARPDSVVAAKEPRTVDPAGAVATHLDVQAVLDRLATRQRAVVVLRFLGDLSVAETARALGVTESTVKSTTRDALAKLRVRLGSEPQGATDA